MAAGTDELWILDDVAPQRDAPGGPRYRVAAVDPHGGHPVWVHEARLPFLARVVGLNLAITAVVPAVLGLGYWVHRWPSYHQWLVGLFLFGFAFGIYVYLQRDVVTKPARLHPKYPVAEPTPVGTSPVVVLLLAVILPGLLMLAVVGGELFAYRFLGVALFCLLTWLAFYAWGERPIQFLREYLLAQVTMPPDVRYTWPRSPCGPDLQALAIMLLIVALVPVYTSTTHALLALVGYCLVKLYHDVQALRRHGELRRVLPYLLTRAELWAMVYLDYLDVRSDASHIWAPPASRAVRDATYRGLLVPLYLTLVVGLSFYCPWEVFAAWSVPDYEVGWFYIPQQRPAAFEWAWGPLRALWEAEPRALMMLAIAIACVLLLVLPPLVLLVIYFPRLVELERLNQLAKRNTSQLAW